VGTRAREKPRHLAAKLLAIRQHLGLSQSEIAWRLGFEVSPARISEWESGAREPNLLVLLSYSQLVNVHLELIVDDNISVAQFFHERSA
jgi:transcriptional regulator with XRE-family HTH domain